MKRANIDIEIISAPSILGLKPGGVEGLGKSLLSSGLIQYLGIDRPVLEVSAPNNLYSYSRDNDTNCLNSGSILDFSLSLKEVMTSSFDKGHFPLVLGGDCSILIGIMSALKSRGDYGLIFMDAHADFYQPEKSITGEVADMDLAIVTGRGPEMLTNINHLRPYVKDENVFHIGQRDQEETQEYGSQQIQETPIRCFDLAHIRKSGIDAVINEVIPLIQPSTEGYWIHFDTDVLADEINPAVDYRIPGGLRFEEVERLIRALLSTGEMAGLSITIFNPLMDTEGQISKQITESLGRVFHG